MKKTVQKTALVTGAAGFIGYHVSKRLLDEGWRVIGLDCMSDYYDVSLKESRESILLSYPAYCSVNGKVETPSLLLNLFDKERPHIVVHLAAQAGVRYSIENPRAYLESNINGTFELLEASREFPPEHMLLASTSSAYGANADMPYDELMKTDHQMSFYAATKKSTESMAHSYSHLFELPITMFRFFTVYGPWGRPDMALFKFTEAIMNGRAIDVYNYGDMSRDFTYIDDLVTSIRALMNKPPAQLNRVTEQDSLSPVAPFRVINIGNSSPVRLTEFIDAIERSLSKVAEKRLLPMQAGDVPATWANVELLAALIGAVPSTPVEVGVSSFIEWYVDFYKLHDKVK